MWFAFPVAERAFPYATALTSWTRIDSGVDAPLLRSLRQAIAALVMKHPGIEEVREVHHISRRICSQNMLVFTRCALPLGDDMHTCREHPPARGARFAPIWSMRACCALVISTFLRDEDHCFMPRPGRTRAATGLCLRFTTVPCKVRKPIRRSSLSSSF